jgi:hypothetical protein
MTVMKVFQFLLVLAVPVIAFRGAAETLADSFFLEIMEDAELEKFCREWDSGMVEGLATGPGNMLGRLIARDEVAGQTILRLRYGNEALVERVVNLYMAEVQYDWLYSIRAEEAGLTKADLTPERRALALGNIELWRSRLERARERDGDLLVGVPEQDPARHIGENGQDYRDQLGALALSTQSPRLYEYLWDAASFAYGAAEMAYFSQVRVEETLQHLFTGTIGTRPDPAAHAVFDRVYRADGHGELQALRAMEYIGRILKQRPELGRNYHSEILDFVERCRTLYWYPEDVIRRSKFSSQDYRMRRAILHVLAMAGTTNDVTLVKKLASEIEGTDQTAKLDDKRVKAGESPIGDLAKDVVRMIEVRNL